MFYYCESEQGSTCSTPFVSAPSSPSRTIGSTAGVKTNSLYYYFSAPSSPPRQEEEQQSAHHRGFSFTECDFQFQSDLVFPANAAMGHLICPSSEKPDRGEDEEMEDAQMSGFYFSAPTSPDRYKSGYSKSGNSFCSYWDEMPGTPKMIFGAGERSPAFLDSEFEFSSSRVSDSDSTISVQMSTADELFFKGQLLPLKPTNHLTSSDSSGSSSTMGTGSVAGSTPHSHKPGKKGFTPVKSAVMGGICMKTQVSSGSESTSDSKPSRTKSLSPLHFLKKYQSIMSMMARPSSSRCSDRPSSSSSSPQIPRPSRSSSKGRTLRELLHLSSMHKTKQVSSDPPPPPPPVPKTLSEPQMKPETSRTKSDNPDKQPMRYIERSLIGDYTKRFNNGHPVASKASRRRFHSGDLYRHGYYNPRRLHSGSIVPEADFFNASHRRSSFLDSRRPGDRLFHSTDLSTLGNSSSCSSSGGSNNSGRFTSVYLHNNSNSSSASSNNGGPPSAASSRNVSPRRRVSTSTATTSSSSSNPAVSLHELHYKTQRANAEDMRRKTFLPYKQGLLGCLGCATMRIAGFSKSLQPMATSR